MRPGPTRASARASGFWTRLQGWLLLSHLAPVLVVTFAVVLLLVGLVRITKLLETLAEDELEALQDEGELHRAAWTLDVSMRHGEDDCATGEAPQAARSRVAQSAERLAGSLAENNAVAEQMLELARDYLVLANSMLSAPGCAGLSDPVLLRRRTELDEQLTNVWVSRLQELHDEVSRQDKHAREFGMRAALVGIFVASLSLALAAFVAVRSARVITSALGSLAEIARRVGRGDFRTQASLGKVPTELAELGDELERMRVQLEQLETLKQEILASISHELRTPLSKIRESLALLQDGVVGAVDPRQEQVVRIARRACESEIRMVTTLLDLSRLRAGSPVRLRDDVALDRLIENAMEDEQVQSDERGVKLQFEAEGDGPIGRFDPVLVERAIANLIRNATAVSKRGDVVLIRRSVSQGRPGASKWACVSVHDRGPGVLPEIRDSMFNAFVTRPVPNSAKGIGVGIGLSLAREVTLAHGGDLECDESVEGSIGATFRLWFPLQPRADSDEP